MPVKEILELSWMPSYTGILLEIVIVMFFVVLQKFFSKSKVFVLFDLMFEKTYEFFEDILGVSEKRWIKLYIITMFFIILFSNLLGVSLEFFVPLFSEGTVANFVEIPTADINFNIAMATIGVIIIIIEQFKTLGFVKTMYEYFPIGGKGLIPFELGKNPTIISYILFVIVKFFDIVISMFLGILDIVGHAAKVISLSFRLFGNMISGGILIAMLIAAISGLTVAITGIELPVIGPVILYLQGLLVAIIQALVFPLLIAIFIKVAKI